MKNIFTLLSFFGILTIANAQSWGDYTLIARQNSTSASLINLNKTAIKTWSLTGSTGYSAYLLPGGDLLRSVMNTGNSFSGGGITGRIQKVNYAGTILWDYVYSTSTYCMHHDICPMPNGNVLIISYESKTAGEVAAAGGTFGSTVWSEKIVELQPNGTNGANVVWEWHLWDHLAQSVDAAKPNYVTSIVNNPQLMNINYKTQKDWVHMNGIDYNSATDQIVVSSHNLNEMWLIDHSTSTAQAASHSGGNSGKGGDFLYRWGNPAAYGAAGSTIFNVVHDAHWVHDGPYAGYFAAFNNRGVSNNQSCVDYILPNYTLTPGQAYLPATYSARLPINTYTSNMGNSQQLPNGNTLVCVSTAGNILEFNPAGTVIWSHNTGGTTPQARRYEASYLSSLPPSTSASASAGSVCANTPVTLNANATGTSLTYAWSSSPAGFTSTSATPSVTPTATTTYTVTVTSGTLTSTSFVTINVKSIPKLNASAAQTTVCSGTFVQLTAAVSGTLSNTFSWATPSGVFSSTQNPIVSPNTSTTYTVTVTSNGCSSTSSVNIVVNQKPIANAGGDIIINKGESTTLTASGGGTYLWSNGVNTVANTVSPDSTTTYSVTVTSANGCTATDDVIVTVNTLAAFAGATQTTICAGKTTELNFSVTGALSTISALWKDESGSFTSSLQNPTVNPTVTTTYTVTITSGTQSTQASVTIFVNPKPIVTISASEDYICNGATVQLNSTVTGTSSNSYKWSSTNGFSATVSNPSHAPTVTTNYVLTVTSASGCTAVAATTVTVKPTPTATISAIQNTICAGTITTLDAIASGATNYIYTWASTPSGFSASIKNPNVSPTVTTTYLLTVNSDDCSTTASKSITVNPLPLANAGADLTINLGETSTITATGGTKYLWSNGATTASITVNPSMTSIYTVTVSNTSGCSATDNVIVNVLGGMLSVFTNPTSGKICQGDSTQLMALVSGGIGNNTFSWTSTPAGFTSNLQNPIVVPNENTTYSLVVKSGLQTASSSVTIAVNVLPKANVGADTSIVKGQTIMLSANGGSNYFWNTGANTQSISIMPITSTKYTVTVTDDNGCTATDDILVRVSILEVIATANVPAKLCSGSPLQLNSIVNGGIGATTYQWASNPIGFSSTLKTPTVTPTASTTYYITVTNSGVQATSSVSVDVLPLPTTPSITQKGDTLISSATTGNHWFYGGGALQDTTVRLAAKKSGMYQVQVIDINGCKSALSTSYNFTHSNVFDAIQASPMKVLPNPTAGIVTLEGDFSEESNYEVIIYNNLGQVLGNIKNTNTLDLSSFDSQLLFIMLKSPISGTYLSRVILEK